MTNEQIERALMLADLLACGERGEPTMVEAGNALRAVAQEVQRQAEQLETYVDQGKRWADSRDVAAHFDAMRAVAA